MRYEEMGWDEMGRGAAGRDGMTTNLKCLGTCFIIFFCSGGKEKETQEGQEKG